MNKTTHLALVALIAASSLPTIALANKCVESFTPAEQSAPQGGARREKIEPRVININQIYRLAPDQSKIRANAKLQALQLFQIVENHYGPLELKKLNIGLNWEALKAETLRDFGSVRNTTEEYQALARFMFKLKDGHVSVEFPSTLAWTTPLQFQNVNRQLLVNFVDGTFPEGTRKPELRDQLLEINGMNPTKFQEQFGYYNALGNPTTDRSIFGVSFGRWREQTGMPLSAMNMDKLSLRLRSHKTGEIYSIDVPIKKEGRGLIGAGINGHKADPKVVSGALAGDSVVAQLPKESGDIFSKFHRLMRAEARVGQTGKDSVTDGSIGKKTQIGGKDSSFKLPEDFKPIQFPEFVRAIPEIKKVLDTDFLTAGTYQRDGKTVGFLRIPSYSPENIVAILPALRFYIHELNKKSDYLVVDQMNNPGGYVTFADWVVKSFVGQYDPQKHMRFALKPSQHFLRQYGEIVDQVKANRDGLLTAEEANAFAEILQIEYNKIEKAKLEDKVLSEPVSMLAFSQYMEVVVDRAMNIPGSPTSAQLTFAAQFFGPERAAEIDAAFRTHQTYDQNKKIFFLINELDFSGGDATPAMLQDYRRVRLVGVGSDRTAGAGGTVEEIELRSQIEAKIRLTTSLMVRADGSTVEGSGVHSRGFNIPLKANDILDGGAELFNRIADAISKRTQDKN